MEKSSAFGDVEGRLFRCHSQENMEPCVRACRRCRAKRTQFSTGIPSGSEAGNGFRVLGFRVWGFGFFWTWPPPNQRGGPDPNIDPKVP